MKTRHLFSFAMFISLTSLFAFTACKSDDVQVTDDSVIATSADEAQMAKTSDEITNETDIYLSGLETSGYTSYNAVKGMEAKSIATYPTVTVDKPDSTRFPKVITIDFGTSGYVNQRGDTIMGKLTVTITGKMYVVNSSRTIEFTDFSINGNSVTGTKTITFKGVNTSKNPYWNITADLSFRLKDGNTRTWKSDRIRERISTNNTPYVIWDDDYSLKGTASGTNVKGKNYSIMIDDNNPLILLGKFPYFVKGDMTVTVGTKTAVIDFGDGTKDNKATVTVNGVTKEIVLKK